MECRAYGICLDSQSRGYLGKDRKVSSAAGGNLSRMHKTQETAKESRLNFMYSHLRNRTLAKPRKMPGAGPVVLPRNTRSANTRDEASKRLAKSHLSRRRKWREITAPGYSLLACGSAGSKALGCNYSPWPGHCWATPGSAPLRLPL